MYAGLYSDLVRIGQGYAGVEREDEVWMRIRMRVRIAAGHRGGCT
jgi:hypothetical protein